MRARRKRMLRERQRKEARAKAELCRDQFRLHIGFGRRRRRWRRRRRSCLRRLRAAAVEARGVARIAISGGTTPKAMFALLADRSQPYFARVPWDKLHLFWVDERCVPPDDDDSNYSMTNEAMLTQGATAGGADPPHGGRAGSGGCGGAVRGGDSHGVPAGGRGDAGVRPGAAGDGRRWTHGVAVSAHRRRCTRWYGSRSPTMCRRRRRGELR